MKIENFVFETDVELIKGMERLGMAYEDILYTLKHEKPHFDKAREFGYEAKYRIKVEIDDNSGVIMAYSGHVDIIMNRKNINLNHLKDITFATPNPSKDDLLKLKYFEELE